MSMDIKWKIGWIIIRTENTLWFGEKWWIKDGEGMALACFSSPSAVLPKAIDLDLTQLLASLPAPPPGHHAPSVLILGRYCSVSAQLSAHLPPISWSLSSISSCSAYISEESPTLNPQRLPFLKMWLECSLLSFSSKTGLNSVCVCACVHIHTRVCVHVCFVRGKSKRKKNYTSVQIGTKVCLQFKSSYRYRKSQLKNWEIKSSKKNKEISKTRDTHALVSLLGN